MPLLEVNNLKTLFYTDEGTVRAVDGVSFTIDAGETLALVGESGCGKSITSLSILRLIPSPPGNIVDGEIWYHHDADRVNLMTLDKESMRDVRGKDIAMIFQEPMTALNPVVRIGHQIAESIVVHKDVTPEAAMQRVVELLTLVGIPEPAARVHDYPHQLSGGMRQRVMIAMALACRPQLLIADEPTTALDVTIQAQILRLLKDLQEKMGMGMLMITHDLGVVANVADRVAVMYAGNIVELADVQTIFSAPKHPYTQGLLKAMPSFEGRGTRARLPTIPGRVPHLAHLPKGCPFQDRCHKVELQCRERMPNLEEKVGGHYARCFFAE